jgi:thiosulfate/3-mercaptopyruvate sulfurtransferase
MQPLVSPDWLAARLDDAGLRLIDLRVAADGGRATYLEAHVPGAVYSDYAGDGWRQRVGNAPGLLPDTAHLSTLFGKLGITPVHHVVLIPFGSSANDLGASARAYWTLRMCGHATVSILNGGSRGWAKSGRPTESGERPAPAAPPYPIGAPLALRRSADEVLAAINAGSALTLDARSGSYFEGREKAPEAKAAGHIPGAISRDYAGAFDTETGALRPIDDLRRYYAQASGAPVISYCNTGHSAALNWFVLSELLGQPDVSLYDGSMTDWTQDEMRPVIRHD